MPEQIKKNNEQETLNGHHFSKEVMGVLDDAGIKHEDFPVNDDIFDQVIVLKKDQPTQEKMVRVYRGIRKIDDGMLEQLPYALRTIVEHEGKSKVKKIESLKAEVEELAANPSYETVLNYGEKVKPLLQEDEVKWLDEDIKYIEDQILKGYSVRNSISYMQVMHGAGGADRGISPFVSATTDPNEAARYGYVVVVMDLPLSSVSQPTKPKHGEVNIKGAIDSRQITAFFVKKPGPSDTGEILDKGVAKALNILTEHDQTQVMSEKELSAARELQYAQDIEREKVQHRKDLSLVIKKRTEQLIQKYPKVDLDPASIQEQASINNTDTYEQARRMIYEDLFKKLKKVNPDDWTDDDIKMEIKDIISRNKLSDEEVKQKSDKLLELINIRVSHLDRRQKEREAERAARKLIEEN